MPRLPRSMASVNPTGPAPTMSTCVSIAILLSRWLRTSEPEERHRVAGAYLLLVRRRNLERGDRRHLRADVMRAALRAERCVGGIQHVIDAVEIEPADQPDAAAAQRGVAVEILEAVEQRLAEARQHVTVVFAGGAAAERGPAGFDTLVEERDHGA